MTFFTLCVGALLGCSDPILEGPNYPAEGPPYVASQYAEETDDIALAYRLLLIGDAGLFLENDPTLAALDKWARDAPSSSVLFLGDNIYDNGLKEEERDAAETILSQQLAATDVHKIFIPGNHDWGMVPSERNIQSIVNQQEYIDDWPSGNAVYVPRDGCMGPDKIVLSAGQGGVASIVLVLLDPTPFMSPRLREVCPRDVPDAEHFARLDEMLQSHADDYVIVASHYPMITGGPHGGLSYGFIGDILVSFYGWKMGTLGDTYEPDYAAWIARMRDVFLRNPPLIYAAGHDHSLQIIESRGEVGAHIVSGAGAPERISTVTHLPESIFAHAAAGFVVVDFGSRDGESVVVLRVIENGSERPVFEMDLARP